MQLALFFSILLITACLFALGTWQLFRLQWKLNLIERVEQRVRAPAVDAPGQRLWPTITAQSDEYRHVRVTGRFLLDRSVEVQAVTRLGSGFWLISPLQTTDGNVVLINRGFISAATAAQVTPNSSKSVQDFNITVVSGLLRMSEPHGGFLRSNAPSSGRWYSRDVQAIATAQNLNNVAPYFIDADASKPSGESQSDTDSPDYPVGGLTIIAFANNHFVYAITWYVLALMLAGACWHVSRKGKNVSRGDDQPS
ncbi:SURF1 family protein [Herbaspirillum sp. RTI4]|uniref:SURF1 family protein n=1 Tax=Herbaspirillum sp. RTI4 TaxID=3048640 RepID=UPI002AB3B583|nr:SURF1 family protein [Herbaspirillum sp. RTI4]MDY7578889.1 SURF1 family protein [Herbaspirillum sp. RTI4]